MKKPPYISVIVPVYNGGKFLDRCLDAIRSSLYKDYELVVVDDGSTDDSKEISLSKGALVLEMAEQSGPGAARNYAAKRAKGEILFFVDADVVVKPDTVGRVAADLLNNPDTVAVFGSYDDEPAERNFLSQYKNLQHHFVHQNSNTDAVTFWAGCGAIRKASFNAVGGFDAKRYRKPSIEDIELGYRLRRGGYKILLDKGLQAKHLKKWRLGSWLRADIVCRAIPWSNLILENKSIVKDLNLQTSDRVSAGLSGLASLCFALSFIQYQFLYLMLASLLGVVLLNRRFYGFFLKRKGLAFAALAFPLHLFYFFYSGTCFVLCWGMRLFSNNRPIKPQTPSLDSEIGNV